MGKTGVLIIECLDHSDPGSEGKFLSHMFDLMEVAHQYLEVQTICQFLTLIKNSPYKIIHITTHGSFREQKKREIYKGWWTPNGTITAGVVEKELKSSLKRRIIVSTACGSGDSGFSRALTNLAECKTYVAPEGCPKFHNAIFFSHIFYHKYFILKKSIIDIMNEYNDLYKNPHEFRYFDNEQKQIM